MRTLGWIGAALALAMGAGAEAQTAPAKKKRAPASTVAATPAPPSAEQLLKANIISMRLADCAEGEGKSCELKAVTLASFSARSDCGRHALAESEVILPDGTRKFAVFRDLFVIKKEGEAVTLEQPQWIKAAELFDSAGIHPVCGMIRIDDANHYVADQASVPELQENGDNGMMGAVIGGVFGGMLGGLVRPRTFAERAGCLLTGCEERNSIAVKVTGGSKPLRILFGGAPTGISTDQTINVSLSGFERLAVKYPDGSVRPIGKCELIGRQRFSRSYDCRKR